MKTSRPSFRRLIALIFIGAGLVAASAALYLWLNGFPPAAPVNFTAPRLTSLTDLNGAPVSLEEYRGSVVLVNLWATWCPPCRAEMPALESFYRKYKDDGFVLIAVNQRESRDLVADFIAEQGLTFPVWLDLAGEAAIKFNTNALPTSYLLDRDGRARWMWLGSVDKKQLERHVPEIIYESQE